MNENNRVLVIHFLSREMVIDDRNIVPRLTSGQSPKQEMNGENKKYTLYTIHTVHYTHCTLYTLYTIHTVHYTHYTHCTLYTLYTIHTVHCVETRDNMCIGLPVFSGNTVRSYNVTIH